MSGSIKVLVVDDLVRARQSIKALLATWPPVAELQEAADGDEAIAVACAWLPDAVVMDIQMAGLSGLAATRAIKARWPWMKVVVLSMYGDYEAQARAAGADAFVSKGEPPARLIGALEAAIGPEC